VTGLGYRTTGKRGVNVTVPVAVLVNVGEAVGDEVGVTDQVIVGEGVGLAVADLVIDGVDDGVTIKVTVGVDDTVGVEV